LKDCSFSVSYGYGTFGKGEYVGIRSVRLVKYAAVD
jgi:hypothetical protein